MDEIKQPRIRPPTQPKPFPHSHSPSHSHKREREGRASQEINTANGTPSMLSTPQRLLPCTSLTRSHQELREEDSIEKGSKEEKEAQSSPHHYL